MPAISKIRLTNVVYEHGQKRYHDEIFLFDGFNGAVVLENGGGKSVFIQTVLQAVIPHIEVGERKIKDTLILDEAPAHIAIEWLLNERPRRYVVTAVTLYKKLNGIDSLRYVYEYGENDPHSIENIPFVQEEGGTKSPTDRQRMADYYSYMASQSHNAKTFPHSIKSYREYIEKQFHIIAGEWESIARINGAEGDIEAFFENCKKTTELVDRLLIPSVEKGIAGFHKDVFSDMFENRREQFKKYKQLKETIEQNRLLSEELTFYVERFEQLAVKENEYVTAQRKAKGYYTFLLQELDNLFAKIEQIELAYEQWEEEQLLLSMKKDSLSIQKERQQLIKREEKVNELLTMLANIEEDLQNSKHEKYSLQYASCREEIRKEHGNIELYNREIERLNQEMDDDALLIELEEVNGQIHYLFLEMKEMLEKQMNETKWELNQLTNEKDFLTENINNVDREIFDWQERLTAAKTKASMLKNEMKSIKAELVSHEDESVEQRLNEWTSRQQKLDEEQVSLKEQLKQLEPKIVDYKDKGEQIQKQLVEKESQLAARREKKRQFDTAHQQVLQQLAQTMAKWTYIDNVYQRQASIENQMEERLANLLRKRESLLERERQAKRFVDDYMGQDLFFADPYVEKQMQQWNQFSYLTTGMQYIDSIKEEISLSENDYPFWALTLITTEKEKNDVIEKIKSIQHHLSYPIYVISAQEAAQLVKGEKCYDEVIEPAIWRMNEDRERFVQWKQQIAEEAERKTIERLEIEETMKIWERAKERFQQFMKEFPHATYIELEETIQSLTHDIQNLKEEQRKVVAQLLQLENEYKVKQEQYHQKQIELGHLQDRLIPKAMTYMNMKKEHSELLKQLTEYEQQRQELVEKKDRLLYKKNEMEGKILEKRDELNNLQKDLLYQVEKNELYQQVKGYRIMATTAAMETLKIHRNQINDQMRQIQTTRREWESRKEHSQAKINDLIKQQNRILKQFEHIDKNVPFPINGDARIDQLEERIRKLTSEEKELSAKRERAMNEKVAQNTKVDEMVKQYKNKYEGKDVLSFVDELSTVEEQLIEEELTLKKRRTFLMEQKQALEKEKENGLDAKHMFNRFELVHKLDSSNLHATVLSEEEKQQFIYNPLMMVEQIKTELDECQSAVLVEKDELAKAKEQFIKFCQQLSDPKLRKNAIEGVETKNTYEAIVNYQQQLQERITRTNQIAEVTIQDYDKEQQQFITYIHTHLRKVREDLLEIQRKTKVKIRDDWKTIYQIQVPDWDEDEAKEKIRTHIDWILEKLEHEQYRDENGREDGAKVRQLLEKYLTTIPILREVLGNETIKVKCRKVESGDYISSNYYTWEQSNQWSGGEKWSKNMALFLGILNFIAEKSQHIGSNAKRHRTVILDNPFGKASSDHVLSPVFFIAEQLGFQMIALTAHAEGKFLSDYFPIIYSCKLRHLEGGTKQVVTKEKKIQVAYFQDHAPESLVRLGEQEQLLLFD